MLNTGILIIMKKPLSTSMKLHLADRILLISVGKLLMEGLTPDEDKGKTALPTSGVKCLASFQCLAVHRRPRKQEERNVGRLMTDG